MHPAATEGFTLLEEPGPADAALASLAAPAARWFAERFGAPTPAQRLAWPALAAGRHLLLSAPTGTGKTLAAFLPLLGRLLTGGEGPAAGVRGLYVAPLKALANDAGRSLEAHLAGLTAFVPPGTPPVHVAVRTGDTPASQRRRQRQAPPAVLLTTPESLAVLLSQPASRALFAPLGYVVVDEIHALAGGKRGADLALSLERLAELASGPVQRVGLSATATPLAEAARFLVGAGRPCAIARVGPDAPPELTFSPLEGGAGFLAQLVERLEPELRSNRSTLVFTNARGLAERLAWALRRRMPDWDALIAVHHSSLAADRRREVEARFKRGQLRAVVSSTSLELGIDIGTVDLAVLIHPPGDVVRLLQRVGRAGHGPGRLRRGLVLTATAAELLEAAVTGASGQAAQCEPLRMPAHPLDVLCQQVLGVAAAGPRSADETFALVRRAAPYQGLSRRDFDDCLAYLRGLGPDGRPWLPARLGGDDTALTIRDEWTARLLRRNLGTILAEEAVPVLLAGASDAGGNAEASDLPAAARPVGQVDQAFADRLQPGDRFLLDGRCLEFRRAEAGALLVEEVGGRPAVPRWGSDGWPLSPELARRLYLLRVQAAEALRDGPAALAALLGRQYGLQPEAAGVLVAYFERQEALSEIPDTDSCLVEAVGGPQAAEYFIHTPLNRPANDALARVAVHRLARDRGLAAASVVADLGFSLQVAGDLGGREHAVPDVIRELLAAPGFEADLDAALAGSAALRERFRRVAYTGLMLLRNPLGKRRRVGGRGWAERELFDRVRTHDPDFVLVRQALREVRADLCDAGAARRFAEDLPRRAVRCRWLPQPSPFAEAWTQPDAGASEAVETAAEALQRLHAALTGGDS
jgi:ATP-dependent Lhr-like helicase